MKISSQIKLTKDGYAGFYSCGMTMIDNAGMSKFTAIDENDQFTLYKSSDGIEMKVNHRAVGETDYTSAETAVAAAGTADTIGKIPDVVEIQTEIVNNSPKDIVLEMADSFVVSEIPGDKIHRFLSFWSMEGRHRVDNVADMNLECSWTHMAYRIERFGNVGSMPVRKYFPFVAVEDSKTGMFTGFQLYSPSSWQMELIVRQDDTLTVTGGIADRDFGHFLKRLKPGEKLITPKAVMATGNSLYDVCDKLVKAQHPDSSPIDDHMGITFNEYCTTWGDPTDANMRKICDKLEGEGIQYLVMDSGWFIDGEGYWWDYTGDWDYSPKRFPNGLKAMADYVRSKGMTPGIWYEFENVCPKTAFYNDTEHLVMKDGVPLTVGDRRFLDMEDPWVRKHLREKVIDNLKKAGFEYIKVDYNDTMGMGCDGPDGMGENLRRKVMATQDFFREMKREIPNLVIENCSSGGHRLEPSMMELSSMASFSDAHEIASLPIIAASLQLLVKPEQSQIWSVLRAADTDSRIYYSMCATLFGRMGLSGDIYDLSDHQWQLLRDGIAFYKSAADIIKSGKTVLIRHSSDNYNEPTDYRIAARIYNEPTGCQIAVRVYNGSALVVFHRFADSVDLQEFVGETIEIENKPLSLNDAYSSYGDASCDFSAAAYLIRLS